MNIELLDNKTHKDLRVESAYFPGLGYDVGAVMLSPNELLDAQREYPIVLRKHHETGEFFINALLGFESDQNLFLGERGDWNADYIPFSVAKGPFMIGVKRDNQGADRPVLSIVRDDPRVGDQGVSLFDEQGGSSPYLTQVNAALAGMHEGMQVLKPFIEMLSSLGLIEPLKMDIEFKDGSSGQLSGMYTIPEERLRELTAQQLLELNEKNYLSMAFYISGSLTNVYKLIRIRNQAV